MPSLRRTRSGFRAPGSALLLLPFAVAGCGDDPTGPSSELDEDPELLSIFAEPVTMSESAQLLLNGDVESGPSEPSPWWSGSGAGQDFLLEWADGVAASGSRSLAVSPSVGPTTDFAFWAQTVDVDRPVGMTFELRVDVLLDDVLGEGVSIAIRGDDRSLGNGSAEVFATTQGRLTVNGTQDWTTLSVKLNSVPGEIDRITVYFVYLPSTSGTAYFDDATLSVSASVPAVELQNPDVEDGEGYPEPWWWGGPGFGDYSFVWSDADASSGSRSLSIARSQADTDEFGFWAQTIDARDFVGRSATLEVEVRAEGLVGEGAAIAVRADDTPQPMDFAEAFATTQGSEPVTGTGGWRTLRVTLDEVPASSRSITIYLIHLPGTRGAVYFDEASLSPG